MILLLWSSVAFSAELMKAPQNLNVGNSESFDSARFQSAIRSDKSLGALAKEHSGIGEQGTSYGFAAKSEEAKFFIIGTLYSEALAYLKAGNYDMAAKRLTAIENEFINMHVPLALYNYISKTRNIITTKRYSPEAQAEFLSLFQPFYEDYAKSKGEDKLTLFRAGSWLMDISLAAAGGDKELLRQQSKLGYFIKEMKRMDAPKGALDALNEIVTISMAKEISDKDTEKVLKLVKKIQTILG
jgi:hypothetical protein